MKRYFFASLIKNGLLGGGIFVDSEKAVFYTNKLTVTKRVRRLELKYDQIRGIEKGRFFFFPTVVFKMKNGKQYKFLILQRKRFLNTLVQKEEWENKV